MPKAIGEPKITWRERNKMKRKLIAAMALCPITIAANAQTSVTVYGLLESGVNYTNRALVPGTTTGATDSRLALDSGTFQGSRLGFRGTEDLGGGLSAWFRLENGFKNDTGALDGSNNGVANTNTLFRRFAAVGLSGPFGNVGLGRQTDWAYQLYKWTSVADFGGYTGAVGHNLDRMQGVRTNNSIVYTSPSIGGFTANAMYGLGEVAGSTSAGQAIGVGGQYERGPLGLGIAYYQSKLGANATNTSSDTSNLVPGTGRAGDVALKVFNLVGSYQAGPARLYANWSQVRQPLAVTAPIPATGVLPTGYTVGGANNNKANIYELGVNYAFSGQLNLMASVQHNVLNYAGNSSLEGKLTQLNIGADYFISKRTDVYAVLSELNAKNAYNPGVTGVAAGLNNDQLVLGVGIRHRF